MKDIKVVVAGTMRRGARIQVAYEHLESMELTLFFSEDIWLTVLDRPTHKTD